MAQLVERVLGKDEVTGSNPVISSIKTPDRTKGSVGRFFRSDCSENAAERRKMSEFVEIFTFLSHKTIDKG